ncbi:unnamed protein product [Sphagnum jensenii]|uniref:Cytochrome c biogenesis B n=1 Tax=Sphagnum jensenii TaxID=128206 RepID=A0ABP1ALM3_9BRYO
MFGHRWSDRHRRVQKTLHRGACLFLVQQIVVLLLLLRLLSWLPPNATAFKKAERRKILLPETTIWLTGFKKRESRRRRRRREGDESAGSPRIFLLGLASGTEIITILDSQSLCSFSFGHHLELLVSALLGSFLGNQALELPCRSRFSSPTIFLNTIAQIQTSCPLLFRGPCLLPGSICV